MLTAIRNATSFMTPMAQDTYWGSFEEISKYNVSLNYFEKLWLAWYTWMGNDVLATGIISFVLHETLYFGRSLPWIIVDMIPYFRKYKIQQVRLPIIFPNSQILTFCRTRFPPDGSKCSARSSFSSRISPSNFLKYGYSTLCANSSDSRPPSHFPAHGRWHTRLRFSSFWRMLGIIGCIAQCTQARSSTRTSTRFTTSTLLPLV